MILLVPQPRDSGIFNDSRWQRHCAETVSQEDLCCSCWPGVTSDTQSSVFTSLSLTAPSIPHLGLPVISPPPPPCLCGSLVATEVLPRGELRMLAQA